MGDMSHEPSMEDILSSIKKIIAEDGDKPTVPRLRRAVPRDEAGTAPAAATEIDVLELTDAVNEAETEAESVAVPTAMVVPEPVVTRPVASLTSARIEKPIETPSQPVSADMILAEASASASRNAFAQINKAKAQAIPADPTHNAIEAMVSDMIRPMLKEWLDANLPRVVEKMVAKEIARLRED
jgi:cell pole-organizing protein PopZ